MASDRNLVWVDLEMTGLDPKTCTILEIATIVTDSQLQIVAEGPNLVIHHSDEVLEAMDQWNTDHHGRSGLTAAVKASKLSLAQAEAQTLAFVQEHCGPNSAPLCGNSIWQDRRFLAEYMPRLEDYLHYRIIDVSSVKEVVRRWYPAGVAMPPRKEQSHRALDDIKDSIEELKFYRSEVFVAPGGSATFATRR